MQTEQIRLGVPAGDKCAEALLPHPVAAGDGVVAVLHRVLGPAGQQLADVGPLVAHLDLGVDQDLVLLLRPHVLRDRGAEVVQPAFSALLLKNTPSTHLLSNSAVNVRRNCRPLLWTKFLHQRAENGVFLLTPGSLPFTHLPKHAPSPFGLEARSPIALGTAPE